MDALKSFVRTANAEADLRRYKRAARAVAKDYDRRVTALVAALRKLAIVERHRPMHGIMTAKVGYHCQCCGTDWDNGWPESHKASCPLANTKHQ